MTEAVVALAIAEIYISQGRIDEAVPLVQNGLRSFRASAWPEGIAEAELQLARIHLAREEYAVAAELATRVMQEFESSQPRYALEAALLLSDARRGSGNAEAALEVVDRALAADSDVGMSRAKAACSRALALAALGRFEESEVEIEAGLKVADEQRLVYERALLLSARRAITESQGNEPDPRDIADAAAAFDVLGVVRPPATRVRRIN
jgi:tetratricopeptide (TPR) repeat protein